MKSSIIDEFWKHFCDIQTYLVNEEDEINEDIHFDLSEKLKEMQENLCLEINLSPRQIIISGDGVEEAFEIVEKIYDKRPTLSSWDIIKYRQSVKDIESQILHAGDYVIKFSEILYDIVIDDEVGIIVIMFIPGFDPANPVHEMLRWVILDKTVGEYDATTKVGYFDTYPIEEIKNLEEGISSTFKGLEFLREDLNSVWNVYIDSKQ